MSEDEMIIDDGNWYAATLGHFVSLMIDAGNDRAVIYRITKDGPEDEEGNYTRLFEVLVIPNGQIVENLEGVKGIHKVLARMLEAEILT